MAKRIESICMRKEAAASRSVSLIHIEETGWHPSAKSASGVGRSPLQTRLFSEEISFLVAQLVPVGDQVLLTGQG